MICGGRAGCYNPTSGDSLSPELAAFIGDAVGAALDSTAGMDATSEGLRGVDPVWWQDFLIGAGVQWISDRNFSSLSIGQSLGRAGLVGVEAIGTDYATLPAGLAGIAIGVAAAPAAGPLAPAAPVAGWVAARVIATHLVDQQFWAPINNGLFPTLGLGNP